MPQLKLQTAIKLCSTTCLSIRGTDVNIKLSVKLLDTSSESHKAVCPRVGGDERGIVRSAIWSGRVRWYGYVGTGTGQVSIWVLPRN